MKAESCNLFKLWKDVSLHLPITLVKQKITGFIMALNHLDGGCHVTCLDIFNNSTVVFKKLMPCSQSEHEFSYEDILIRCHLVTDTSDEL